MDAKKMCRLTSGPDAENEKYKWQQLKTRKLSSFEINNSL